MSFTRIQDIIYENSINIDEEQKEYMCAFNSSILIKFGCQWKYNREINHDKVTDIAKYIKQTNKSILDTVIHCFLYNEQLIVFDGQHRIAAMKTLYDLSGIDIKTCCYIYDGSHLTGDNIDTAIVEKFKIINLNTPIPDIYNDILDDLSNKKLQHKKEIIEKVFNIFKTKYKMFYSIKPRCHRPNFNENKFKDLVNECLEKYCEENCSLEELLNVFEKLNTEKKLKFIIEKKNCNPKCLKHNFYIFS